MNVHPLTPASPVWGKKFRGEGRMVHRLCRFPIFSGRKQGTLNFSSRLAENRVSKEKSGSMEDRPARIPARTRRRLTTGRGFAEAKKARIDQVIRQSSTCQPFLKCHEVLAMAESPRMSAIELPKAWTSLWRQSLKFPNSAITGESSRKYRQHSPRNRNDRIEAVKRLS